ncbi:MAG TPA: TetR/AcrR family transcriptional regulator [Anaerolineales bacterium]|nr:TetR/AcrR family transcriptional regulator [Anaerolineales bacterium]
MPKDKLKKGETTRIAIEDAALELFMQYGFHGTSMRQIAEQAELALGGIYNHFSSKEEIFAALIMDNHPYKQIVPLILAAEGGTAEELFYSAAQAIVSELGKRQDFLKLMFIEVVEFNGKHINLLITEVAPQLLPVFEKVVKVRKNLRHTNPAILIRSFLGLFFSYYITDILLQGTIVAKIMPKDSFEQFVDIYLHGVIKESV